MTAGTPLRAPAEALAGSGWERMAVVGRIARSHGRRGEVIVDPSTDFPELRFRSGSRLFAGLEGRVAAFRVAAVRFQRGRPIVGFESVSDIDSAERLAGVELRVPEAELAPLPPDTFYEHDLVGCGVETVDGRCIGAVRRVEAASGASRLIVDADGLEVDVPLVDAICVRVAPAARTVVVDPPAGLLDLNRRQPRRRPRTVARGVAGS
ncbi:MAG: 16S rRNA processing protein RimM [Acidobacteria bacterium]|nr:16S rRNA processing protein RimM [Acidobacteriota bacterium]